MRGKAPRSPASHEPFVDTLRRQIVDGKYGPGSRLPNRTDLIAKHRICSSALQKAQDTLRDEGFLHARPRHGTFVTDHPPHLFHIALAFDQPDLAAAGADRAPFAAILAHEATAISGSQPWKLTPFFAVSDHANNPDMARLRECVRARRLAGLIVTNPFSLHKTIQSAAMPCLTFTGSTEPAGLLCIKLDPHAFLERALQQLQTFSRKRVGLIASSTLSNPVMDYFHAAAARHGLASSPRWVHGVNLRHPHWARHAVRATMQGRPDERPDSLIITDDNLIEPTLAGLMDEQLSVPENVEVIAHCNFQGPPRGRLPVRRLGYVVRDLLRLAIDLIDRKNRGENVPTVTRLHPSFDHELAAAAPADHAANDE